MSKIIKIKKTIYITPETSGRIEYEAKISGRSKQEIIEKNYQLHLIQMNKNIIIYVN